MHIRMYVYLRIVCGTYCDNFKHFLTRYVSVSIQVVHRECPFQFLFELSTRCHTKSAEKLSKINCSIAVGIECSKNMLGKLWNKKKVKGRKGKVRKMVVQNVNIHRPISKFITRSSTVYTNFCVYILFCLFSPCDPIPTTNDLIYSFSSKILCKYQILWVKSSPLLMKIWYVVKWSLVLTHTRTHLSFPMS